MSRFNIKDNRTPEEVQRDRAMGLQPEPTWDEDPEGPLVGFSELPEEEKAEIKAAISLHLENLNKLGPDTLTQILMRKAK